MNLVTEKQIFAMQSRQFLRWTRRLLLATGVLALSYVAMTLLYAMSYQRAANQSLERKIHEEERFTATLPRAVAMEREVREGDLLGRVEIPRIGMTVAILEGTTSQTLRLGAGHIVGTPLPGEQGNIGIAGHRDTWFRELKEIRANDDIQIRTATGLTHYQVDWVQIVAPSDTGILAPSTESAVTLVTCYPFHYIGAAPERFVVHANKY